MSGFLLINYSKIILGYTLYLILFNMNTMQHTELYIYIYIYFIKPGLLLTY